VGGLLLLILTSVTVASVYSAGLKLSSKIPEFLEFSLNLLTFIEVYSSIIRFEVSFTKADISSTLSFVTEGN
jgi:hypothetical protein